MALRMTKERLGLPRPGGEKEALVRSLFDTIAPRYDLMNRVMTAGFFGRWQRSLAEVTGLSPGRKALDVCCGTGDLALIMAGQVAPGGEVTGLDFSPRMLDIARRKASRWQAAWETRIDFVTGDALQIPFPDRSFDCAAIGFALRNVSDIGRCLGEMARVVHPGGRVVALEVCRPSSLLVRAWFYPYFYTVVPLLGILAGFGQRLDRSPLRPYTYLPRSLAYLPGLEELATAFRGAGLSDVHYRVLPPGVAALHWGTVPAVRQGRGRCA
ncbi:MAG: ubiquinone/menaquinone biosynthesis methyltransferase [Bacillota bacterium]|nr:ubiquinone/menaquinone biosynthesis methyltransferase [Bacillota bacterium]